MSNFCQNCGKEIGDGFGFCPNCGTKIEASEKSKNEECENASNSEQKSQNQSNNQEKDIENIGKINPFCIAGLVVSGLSVFLRFYGIIGVVGFIISLIGYKQVKHSKENGKILSIIGIAVGAVTSVVWFLVCAVYWY